MEAEHHVAAVDAWLARAGVDASPQIIVRRFERVLSALWLRTKTTLGEVTLTAIVDRVLHNASEQFSAFTPLTIDADGGVHAKQTRTGADALSDAELKRAIRFVLIEFLSVIGNLTADILTPDLHATLENVGHEGEDQAR